MVEDKRFVGAGYGVGDTMKTTHDSSKAVGVEELVRAPDVTPKCITVIQKLRTV